MKKCVSLALALSITTAATVQAAPTMTQTGDTLTFASCESVSGSVFSNLGTVYYSELSGDGSSASTTHLLVGPLSCVSPSQEVFAGYYEMINATSGSELSSGSIGFKLGASYGADTTYPIVGVLPLSGGWSNSSVTTSPLAGDLAGASGSLSYNPSLGLIALTLGSNISYIPYVETSNTSVEFESPFWITSSTGTIYEFRSGYLEKEADGTYKGVLMEKATTDSSSVYRITLTGDTNDSDSDGVIDLFDTDNYWYAGATYDHDTSSIDVSWMGKFYFYYPPRWEGSMSGYNPAQHAIAWNPYHGYLYGMTATINGAKWVVFFDFNLGWLATNSSLYPFFYAYAPYVDGTFYPATWLYYSPGTGSTGKRMFYAYNGTMATGNNTGYTSWWQVSGAK
jgi:hypothetical protein